MKISAIKTISVKTPAKIKKITKQIPKKVTIDNLPIVAGGIGLITPIPFASAILFAVGKLTQIAVKKFLHKP